VVVPKFMHPPPGPYGKGSLSYFCYDSKDAMTACGVTSGRCFWQLPAPGTAESLEQRHCVDEALQTLSTARKMGVEPISPSPHPTPSHVDGRRESEGSRALN
jgi:hypothetical protein